jgi:hypothetical protein
MLAENFGQEGDGIPGDLNNDGVVDGADLLIWQSLMGDYGGFDDLPDEADPFADFANDLDANNDGTISNQEWRAWRDAINALIQSGEYNAEYDLNGDGVVDNADLNLGRDIRDAYNKGELRQLEDGSKYDELLTTLAEFANADDKPAFTDKVGMQFVAGLVLSAGRQLNLRNRYIDKVNADREEAAKVKPSPTIGDGGIVLPPGAGG